MKYQPERGEDRGMDGRVIVKIVFQIGLNFYL